MSSFTDAFLCVSVVPTDQHVVSAAVNCAKVSRLPNTAPAVSAKRAKSVSLRLIKPERLLVKVAEQMERFNGHVGALKGALQQAPEVLQPVGVDLPINVRLGVVDDVVDVSRRSRPFVRDELIGVDVASRLRRCCANVRLASALLRLVLDDVEYARVLCPSCRGAASKPIDGDLASAASAR